MIDKENAIYYMVLNKGFNMFDPEWMEKANKIIDEVDATEGEGVFVAINRGKVFSSGMNLNHVIEDNPKNGVVLFCELRKLCARILCMSMPTLAVLNGHAVAGGLFLTLAFDRVMMTSSPKTRLHLNELDLPILFVYGIIKYVVLRTSNSVG